MTECRSWITQAQSDFACIARIYDVTDPSTRCQAIAKCQQTVEKSVKALVISLRDYRIIVIQPGWTHSVERFAAAMTFLPRSTRNKGIQARIHGLLDSNVRSGIRALDQLAPRRPLPEQEPSINTEYPFKKDGQWHAPADEFAFADGEVIRFRSLAHKILSGCRRIVATIELMSLSNIIRRHGQRLAFGSCLFGEGINKKTLKNTNPNGAMGKRIRNQMTWIDPASTNRQKSTTPAQATAAAATITIHLPIVYPPREDTLSPFFQPSRRVQRMVCQNHIRAGTFESG